MVNFDQGKLIKFGSYKPVCVLRKTCTQNEGAHILSCDPDRMLQDSSLDNTSCLPPSLTVSRIAMYSRELTVVWFTCSDECYILNNN